MISSNVTEETRGGLATGAITPGRVPELLKTYPNLYTLNFQQEVTMTKQLKKVKFLRKPTKNYSKKRRKNFSVSINKFLSKLFTFIKKVVQILINPYYFLHYVVQFQG